MVEIFLINIEVGDVKEEIILLEDVVGELILIVFSFKYLNEVFKVFNLIEVIFNFVGEIKLFVVKGN